MYANYHTHTYRSHHATGTEEEYIERALKHGIKIMGFSDHAPFLFPDGHEDPWRISVDDGEAYIKKLHKLREKYKDRLYLPIGFEMEYYPAYFDDMFSYVKGLGAEYLILGQHFSGEKQEVHSGDRGHTEEELILYTDTVIAGMKTGKFLYVAHPDMFRFEGDEDIYKREVLRLCKASVELNVPLELNFLGMSLGRHYPREKFWEIAGREGVTVIYGFDTHDVKRAYDGESLEKAKAMSEKYSLNVIDEIEIKEI